MGQDEVLKWFKEQRKHSNDFFAIKDIDPKIRTTCIGRSVNKLVAWDDLEVEIPKWKIRIKQNWNRKFRFKK